MMVDAVEKYGTIVILDALGTKGRWKKDLPKNIIAKWELIVKSYIKRFTDARDESTNFSKIQAFSDTIMISTTGNDPVKNFLQTAISVSFFTAQAMMNDIFFRGCISIGKYYWSERLLIGPAVDEAAQYYMLPEWIGISATPKAHIILSKLAPERYYELEFPSDMFVKYNIPTKNGIEVNGLALNLPQAYEYVKEKKGLDIKIENPPEIESIFEKQLEQTDDITAAFKIRNTLEFFKNIPKRKAEEIAIAREKKNMSSKSDSSQTPKLNREKIN